MRSSTEEAYISDVSCRCLARSSNSVGSAGAGGIGRPQLGLPCLRVWATGIAIGADHTPTWVALQESAHGWRAVCRPEMSRARGALVQTAHIHDAGGIDRIREVRCD